VERSGRGTSSGAGMGRHPRGGLPARAALIQERDRLRDELASIEALNRATFEAALDALVTMDAEGRILDVNPAAEALFGYARDDVIGRRVGDTIVPPTLRDAHRVGLARFVATGESRVLGTRIELTAMRANGEEFPVELAITKLDLPGPPVFAASIRDRSAPLALAHEQALLQQRLEDRARTLEQVVEDLHRADEQRRTLLGQLVWAEEKERRTIAEGIHDDSIQKMTAVGIRLSALRRLLEDETQLVAVEQISETVAEAIARLRLLLFELHPRSLETGTLVDAIREYLDLSFGGSGLACTLDASVDEPLPPVIRTTAYRIVQEALANVRKHSGAEHVEIALNPSDGGLYGRVRDDGVGVGERADTDLPGHMGLAAMRERAERAGGWARVGPAEAGGTLVEFWLPTDLGQPAEDGRGASSKIVSTTAE
jgi:PAS domain S-box-containing protein